jgi:hypothetical protein
VAGAREREVLRRSGDRTRASGGERLWLVSQAELALARRSGAPWVVGRSLWPLGELTGDA